MLAALLSPHLLTPTKPRTTRKLLNLKMDYMKRAKALVPLFIPLLFNSIRRAYELANAMTCRCYNGGVGKTTMNALKFSLKDYLSIIVMAFLIVGIIVINIFCGEYNAEFTFNLAI